MAQKQTPIRLILLYARPLELLAGALMYALGAGLMVYLGNPLDWSRYFLGQGCITLLQMSAYFLKSAFDLPPTRNSGIKGVADENIRLQASVISRSAVLLAAATTLTAGAVLTVILISENALVTSGFLIIGVGVLLAVVYGAPPFRLVYAGYGELILAFIIANLIPAFSFSLQAGELHRLLALLTFPLTALFLALQMAFSLPNYANDEHFSRKTMMVRLGWAHGMNLHNLLILFSYLLLGAATLLELPWALLWPGLITLPIGIFQIWQMGRIAGGAKPNWTLLRATAAATFVLTAYFLAFALWTA